MTAPRVLVRVSDLVVADAPARLAAVALGSCVAIVLHEPTARIGGMAHVLLPSQAMSRDRGHPGRFAQTAVPTLVERMIARGARAPAITARLVGGASMFTNLTPPGTIQMGDRNVVAAREALHRHGIRLVAEAVGGDFGRTAELDVDTGRLSITSYLRGTQYL
ncbi:MAG: chemotaxis protein CheD [Gemmatimonadales bacterium]